MLKKILQIVGILIIIFVIGIIIFGIYVYSEPKIPILSYHNVIKKEEIKEESLWTISAENFEEEMKYLHDTNYKTLTMEEFCKWKEGEIELPFKSVLVTFDDGLLSNYQYAFPILKKYNINATLFVIGETSEKIGDAQNKWQGVENSYLSKAQIDKIKEEYPNVEMYSHTYGMHLKENEEIARANLYTEEQMAEDIKKYEEYMGKTEIIAYPFGITNETFIKVLKEQGYKYGFLLGDNRKATRKDDNFLINRINTSTDKDIFHFAGRLLLPY